MAFTIQFNHVRWCLLSFTKHNKSRPRQFFSSTTNRSRNNNHQEDMSTDEDIENGQNDEQKSDHNCVEFSGDWAHEPKASVLQNMLVFPNFITELEEESIVTEIGPYLRRMRYEFDHWDDAIHGFRETERLQWRPENERVLSRVRRLALPPGTPPLRHVHVLDLAADGVIKPHVDSVRFCGSVITGLSLLSDAVMRLVSCAEPARRLDALLPRRSLYIMRNTARYDYTHEILAGADSQFAGRPVTRGRRISIICRNEPPSSETGGGSSGAGEGLFAAADGGYRMPAGGDR